MVATVERPDLSLRTALSKSVLTAFELCEQKAWFGIHDPRPFVPKEKVTFGAAVDAGVEVIIKYVRSGQKVEIEQAYEAARFVIERDAVEVDFEEVAVALRMFIIEVVPKFDWAYAKTQESVTAELDQLGECNGHPDLILRDNRILDVKTASRAKDVPSLELGFYALLQEAASGKPVPFVGYLCWVRVKRPYWQITEIAVTDGIRRWAYERSASYVRAKKADALLNAKAAVPQNYSFPGSARFAGLCADCEYNPANGGPCLVSLREDAA